MRPIEFFFDVGSPYSYLCATQIDAVGLKHDAVVRWRPMLLGGVFKAVGNEPPARLLPKAKWMRDDLAMWAAHYEVPFVFPAVFPANTLRAMRACVAADRAGKVREVALSLFASYWARGTDPSSDEALRAAATAASIDPSELLTAVETQPVKDALRAHTDEAVARGAFGAPTLFVGDTMFWGNDRLTLLDQHLSRRAP